MLIFDIFIFFIILLLIYIMILSGIRLFTGVTFKEARNKLYGFFKDGSDTKLEQNTLIYHDYEIMLSRILGETRFGNFIRLKERCFDTFPYGIYVNNAVPMFYFTCIYNDDTEKDLIALNTKKLVTRYLKLYGLPEICLVEWDTHKEMQCPMLNIFFARNEREKKSLKTMISEINVIYNAEKPIDEDNEDDTIH